MSFVFVVLGCAIIGGVCGRADMSFAAWSVVMLGAFFILVGGAILGVTV